MPKANLVELYAHKLGVIDDARLEFGSGFNVITGETGAGKTLLLGALGLSLGADASASRYALTADTRAVALFEREGDELAFSREVSDSGRLRSSLNGAPSSVEALRNLAEGLIVIHGQHDSLTLRSRSEVLRLIDDSGTVDSGPLDLVRRELREALRLRSDFGGDLASRERETEFLTFQLGELDGADIRSASELDETLEELTRLTALRDGQVVLVEVLQLLDGEGDEAVLNLFAHALSRLPDGDAYAAVRQGLDASLIQAREALHELAALTDPEAFDPTVLAELESRAEVLQHMARKYGGSLEAALSTREDLRARLQQLTSEGERLGGLDVEIAGLEEKERVLVAEVKRQREIAAESLTVAIARQMARVALAHATLRFVVDGVDGSDAQILFTPNPGQPEGPLSALASGGELSRVLLAVSLETVHHDTVAVFDEIDAGLGGQVAQQIGECLREVGREQQVIAITHLASVAARADHHFVIEKDVAHGVTTTSVKALRGEERVREVARMLAGTDVTDESRALAEQLLQNSTQDPTIVDFSR
ncbi:MAG: AAA family ATPase [Acidimicrobiales bacterium]|jgi:DNA repair protein RecN (Recombination protein N)